MADEVEIAKIYVDVLTAVFQQDSTFTHISNIITASSTFIPAFQVVGAVLVVVQGFLPDRKHEEILGHFNRLSNKIDQVRGDIQDLEKTIIVEFTELKYGGVVTRIETGIGYCLDIGKRRENDGKIIAKKKLEDFCANENCATALNDLLDGMIRPGLWGGKTILDKFYDQTGGDRKKISALATRLLQVACEGMILISTYETMVHGKKEAGLVTERYYRRMNETRIKVQDILDKCVVQFEGNMLNDLTRKLDAGGSNENIVVEISSLMSKKYDWLENFCLVYNDLHGFDQHTISGYFVSRLHRNGKCGVVFYRRKGRSPNYSFGYNDAYASVHDTWCGIGWFGRPNAQDCKNKIVDKMKSSGIGWIGCAVIKRGPDLCWKGTFSTQYAYSVGKQFTKILLLK